MSTAPRRDATGPGRRPGHGATALAPDGPGHAHRHLLRHPFGDALRAVRVFAGTAFDVVVLGEYDVPTHPAPGPRRA
ncbi:hypothetical protein [Streptomyces sp. JJ36]|uniref:hypothetical protein n=1 Tax=Streptomyces sp. JJ36 TaxID=2736645 RepID=UPI001F20A634|nr:hypothetical protein [Streptomyces sp. JJ36]MCF6523082.1 hypothetical protein [Streptomyces sp. JJ36]